MLVLGMGVLHPVNDDMSSLKAQVEAQKPCPKGTCIPLLAPLGNSNTVTISTANTGGVSAAIGTFVAYFSDAFALLDLIAVGFCVLWSLDLMVVCAVRESLLFCGRSLDWF